MRNAHRFLLLISLVVAGGCINSRVVSHTGRDDTARTMTGVTSVGSGELYPADGWREKPDEERLIQDPTEEYWPELPIESIRRIERFMTEDELIALLGEPVTKEVAVTDIDTNERDWNATVFTWKYQDSSITTVEMTRDLEVRLGYVYTAKELPARPQIVGPAWVVVGWDLF